MESADRSLLAIGVVTSFLEARAATTAFNVIQINKCVRRTNPRRR